MRRHQLVDEVPILRPRTAPERESKLRARRADGGMLWGAWPRAPRHVGALMPSGMKLAAAMARFPDCRVLCGDACRLPRLRAGHDFRGPVKTVVSSLPLLAVSPGQRARLMRGVRRLLVPTGVMVRYTYGVRCPMPARTLSRDNVTARRIDRVWRNVPPASVWRFESAAAVAGGCVSAHEDVPRS